MTVGDRIRLEREKRGWSQLELAKKCGYSGKSSICKIEIAGDSVSTKKVKMLADIFGVSPSYLMGWADEEGNELDENLYYLSEEAADLAQFALENPSYKVLFDASRKVPPEDISKALKAINIFVDDDN